MFTHSKFNYVFYTLVLMFFATLFSEITAEDFYQPTGADGAYASNNDDIEDLKGHGITVSSVPAPTITSATYDPDSGIFVVIGTDLFENPGAANDIDVSKFTITGQSGNYIISNAIADVEITSATEFSFTVTGDDKTQIDARLDLFGTQSSGGTIYNLAAAEDWLTAADPAANIADLTNNGITVMITPKITSATYNASVGVLTVTGTNIQANSGGADIDASKFTLTGEGGVTYTLTTTPSVERTSATQFTLTLSITDWNAIAQIMNKNGTTSTSGTAYNLAAADDWCTNVTAGNSADLTGNGIAAGNVPVPTINSATYNAATGVFVVSGIGLVIKSGALNDIDISKFTITGEGGETYPLVNTPNVEITSGSQFTFTLNSSDKAEVNMIMNNNGLLSTSGTAYNLAAAEDWASGVDAAVNVVDATSSVSASNVSVPVIISASYHWSNGILTATGTGFTKKSGAANDMDASKLTFRGEGGVTYTLVGSSDAEITSGTEFSIVLDATDKAAVNLLLNKPGTQSNDNTVYNLAAAEDWALGANAAVNVVDFINPLTAGSFNTPPTGANDVVNTHEDIPCVFKAADFTFNDPDLDDFAGIQIQSLETNGILQYDGTDVTAGLECPDVTKLVFTPAADASGTPYADFSFKVRDDRGAYSLAAYTMTINVTPVNDPPTISDIGDLAVDEDERTDRIGFAVFDRDTDPITLTLRAISGNTELVKPGNIVFGGSGTDRTVRIKPEPEVNGTVQITLFVSDGEHQAKDRFSIVITGVNDRPVLAEINDIVFDEDSTCQVDLDTLVSDQDDFLNMLSWTAELFDGDTIQAPPKTTPLSISINDTTHVATFSALPDYFGTHQVIFTVSDPQGGKDTDTCTVMIKPVNDPPVFLTSVDTVTLEQGMHIVMPDSVLYPFVEDVDHLDSSLSWSVIPNLHLNPVFADRMISLEVPFAWAGTETIVLIVSDGALNDSMDVLVTVVPPPDTTGPAVPLNFTVIPEDGVIGISWDLNTEGDIESYVIYRTVDSTAVSESDILARIDHPIHIFHDSTAVLNIPYFYGLRAMDTRGNRSEPTPLVKASLQEHSGMEMPADIPEAFNLDQNFPNPFNPVTTIRYSLPRPEQVSIRLFNSLGQNVATLVDKRQEAGHHTIQMEGSRYASGIYVVAIQAGTFRKHMKMILMK